MKKIRAHAQMKALPVIVLTAKGQSQDRETAVDIGADLFLTKPRSNKDIVSVVQALVEA